MIEHVAVTRFGRPATRALAERVRAAKDASHPLAPVTVVVASNFAGLTARRLLASDALQVDGGPRGVANVAFVTPLRLVNLLAPPTDHADLTNPVLGAAVRRALADHRGPLRRVREHPATETAVSQLYAELSRVSPASLDAIAATSRVASEAVELHRAIAARLVDLVDENHRAAAALARPDLDEAIEPLGHVIWHLPDRLTPSVGELIAAVLERAPSSVVVALTGAPDADRTVHEICDGVGVPVTGAGAEPPSSVPGSAPTASAILSVTDADEEAREVVRHVVALAAEGISLDRIGVFYPVRAPYLRSLQHHFERAAIPTNSPAAEKLADTAAGRTLLAALALPAERWRRDRVMALIAGAPVRFGAGLARSAPWERLTREAGVVRDNWSPALENHGAAIRKRLDAPDNPPSESRRARLERTLADLADLWTFAVSLAASVQLVADADGWAAKADAAQHLLHDLLGQENVWQRWDDGEQTAAQLVEAAVARLGELDSYDPDPDDQTFRRALLNELDRSAPRRAAYGHGVTIGPLQSAAGYDLDAVIVVGMAEGQCPAPRGDDALLPDAARAAAAGELVLRAERLGDQHRAFLAALDAAPVDRRLLTFPRGDLRGGRHHLPSRWLLDTASALAGRTIYSTEFEELDCDGLTVVASHASAVDPARPVSLADWEVASLAAETVERHHLVHHPASSPVRRGLDCIQGRASDLFTEWDGNLTGEDVPSPARTDEILSATRLESWAECGMRYLLGSVLGVGERDDPEAIIELSARDRGSALHESLERFVAEAISGSAVPEPAQRWSDAQRHRLVEITSEVLADLERRHRTGRPLLWQLQRQDTLERVVEFLDADERVRAALGSTPVHVEMPFGVAGADPVTIELADGRSIRFRGWADRVDRTHDGRHVVLDYKSGKPDKYKGISEGDCVRGGRTLQLGLYSEAVRQILGASAASAYYWMIDGGAAAPTLGYAWDDERRGRFIEVVTAIVDGIEAGVFAMNPGEWSSFRGAHENCRFCPFDTVCPRDRSDQAAAIEDDPALEVRRALAEPELTL